MRGKGKPIERTPYGWPPVGTLAKCDQRNGVEWNGPLFEITEAWKIGDGRNFTVELHGVILEPHNWPVEAGKCFTCNTHDVTFPNGTPPEPE